MSDKDRCLKAAEECERMAKRTPDATDRATLLNMAKLWRELGHCEVANDYGGPTAHKPAPQQHS